MAEVVSLRLPPHLLLWATEYAKSRGVSRTDLLVEGLESFKAGCERGVPEIRVRARPEGHGDCPKNKAGHVWRSAREDPRRRCVYCGRPGRGDQTKDEDGNIGELGAARAVLFQRLKAPMENGSGKPEKVRDAKGA